MSGEWRMSGSEVVRLVEAGVRVKSILTMSKKHGLN
jgi:hypothetical protein